MATNQKQRLLERLSGTYADIKVFIEGLNLDTPVYGEEGDNWRIRDILGHITTWDREITKAIQAQKDGETFINPEYSGEESQFNEEEVAKQRQQTTEQLLEEWNQAREELKQVLTELPDDKFLVEFEFPWGGERGNVVQLVEYFIGHDIEHLNEIKDVL